MNYKVFGAFYESLIWIAFAGAAYYFSSRFEKEIEIYRYGASGWPRTIIVLILIAAICLFLKRNSSTGLTEKGVNNQQDDIQNRTFSYYLRMGATLLLPVIYAMGLEKIGFYTLTPFFIFALLLLAGERRIKVLLLMTIGIYTVFVFVFGKLLYINLPVGNMHPFYDFSNWLLVIIR